MKAGDNPFAPGRLERVLGFDPALAGTTWEALAEKWRALGGRAAVTGHRGSGKSALLRAWARRCDLPVELHFNEQRRRLDEGDRERLSACDGRLLIIDGEDYLHWRDRRSLRLAARSAGGVLVSRYRSGRWPELLRLSASEELAATLLERAAPAEVRNFGPRFADHYHRCHGNLRELWLGCYDDLAGRKLL
jgi:hypothetical protein